MLHRLKKSLRSLKIPFGFLISGIFWSVFSDPLISIVAQETDRDTRDIIRSCNDFAFVGVVAVVLYFKIKKQHRRLIDSEDQYRRLFELNPNPMWIYHIASLRFVKVNEAAINLYDYTKQEFLAMTIMDIRPEDDRDKLITTIESLGPGVRHAGKWRHFKKNGELLHVSIVSYNIEFNGEACSLVMANNITELILNEEKIKAQNSILQDIAWSNSHEVRRSLCSVMSLVDLLKNAESETDRNEYVLLLERCSAEIDVLIKHNNEKVEALQDAKSSFNT